MRGLVTSRKKASKLGQGKPTDLGAPDVRSSSQSRAAEPQAGKAAQALVT
jgi:hypothetical protein